MNRPWILGTRGSRLALAQSRWVAACLEEASGRPVELQIISTKGDRIVDRPLAKVGGKGLFTAELEAALRDGSIHLAVHSLKDLPTEDPEGLVVAAIPVRADVRDVLVGPALDSLPAGAVVGTGSLRRRVQLLALRPDLEVRDIRGNVPTRLAKLDAGEFDAIVLAAAGLARLGIERDDIRPFSVDQMVPAPGQGALGIQCRRGGEVEPWLLQLEDPAARLAITAERAFLAQVGGGCNEPVGALAEVHQAGLRLVGAAPGPDGAMLRAELLGSDPAAMGVELAQRLGRTLA